MNLHHIQERFFNLFIIISYTLIFVSFLGLSSLAPAYLENLDYYIRIYICLFLLWRFNPFRKEVTFTDLDRKIAFSAGFFLLTTTAIDGILKNYLSSLYQYIKWVKFN